MSLDLFDRAAVRAAVEGHQVVCNLTTHIPPLRKMATPGAWKENDRVRREISNNLADGCLATGIETFVQESVVFVYADGGDAWLAEDAALDPAPYVRSALRAEAAAARVTQAGKIGIVLRFGAFYGPESDQVRAILWLARRGWSGMPGRAGAWLASIHVDDAAAAVVAVLAAPAGIYNVCDDLPVTRREYADAVGAALGVRPMRLLPAGLLRLGGSKARTLGRSLRLSNRHLKDTTGWQPAYPRVDAGLAAIVDAPRNE